MAYIWILNEGEMTDLSEPLPNQYQTNTKPTLIVRPFQIGNTLL